jgi:osmotically-inducible protein OsmY
MTRDVVVLADVRSSRAVRDRLSDMLGERTAGVRVDVHGDVAVLRGAVGTAAIRAAATATARLAPGIRTVEDELAVAARPGEASAPAQPAAPPEPEVPDDELATAVADALGALDAALTADVRVDVRHGEVLLAGSVEDHADRMALVQAVASVDGVREVLSGIVLRCHPAARLHAERRR